MMSNERFQQIVSGMTAQAMCIYNAVPKEEHWTAHQVTGELTRLNVQMSPAAVTGCLDSLVRCGIIKENNRKFIRTKVRKPTVKKKTLEDLNELAKDLAATIAANPIPQETPMTTPTLHLPKPKEKSLTDIIGDLAQQIQAAAQRHREEMATLADLVADIAIDVQAREEHHAAETVKLTQLRSLLKDF